MWFWWGKFRVALYKLLYSKVLFTGPLSHPLFDQIFDIWYSNFFHSYVDSVVKSWNIFVERIDALKSRWKIQWDMVWALWISVHFKLRGSGFQQLPELARWLQRLLTIYYSKTKRGVLKSLSKNLIHVSLAHLMPFINYYVHIHLYCSNKNPWIYKDTAWISND